MISEDMKNPPVLPTRLLLLPTSSFSFYMHVHAQFVLDPALVCFVVHAFELRVRLIEKRSLP